MVEELNIKNRLKETFAPLEFYEKKHLYYWEGIRVPASVTGLIKRFEEPFDEKVWLPRCSKKEGVTEQELKQRWDNKRDYRCRLGTTTHSFLEYFNGTQNPKTPQEEAGIKFFKELNSRYKLLSRELRVYHPYFEYAGTIDIPLWDTYTETIVIGDYKTNEDLFKTYGNLKPPFQWLQSNPYNKYQLQLSYYQMALEYWKFKVSARLLIYLGEDGNYQLHELADFTTELTRYHST